MRQLVSAGSWREMCVVVERKLRSWWPVTWPGCVYCWHSRDCVFVKHVVEAESAVQCHGSRIALLLADKDCKLHGRVECRIIEVVKWCVGRIVRGKGRVGDGSQEVEG